MKIFKPLPSLEGLSVDELNTLRDERRDLCVRLGKNDAELAPPDEFSGQDILDEITEGVEQIKILDAELAQRAEAEQNFTNEATERLAAAGIELVADADAGGDDDAADAAADADADGDADADAAGGDDADAGADAAADDAADAAAADDAADADADALAASAVKQIRRPLARPARRQEAVVVDDQPQHTALVASVDYAAGQGVKAGDELDRMGFARAAIATAAKITPHPGQAVQVVVASAKWDAPAERQLDSKDADGNADKIRALTAQGQEQVVEMVAAGNVLCAPLTPIYDLPQISTELRPVRDSLPPFQADRGGITWGTPPSLADVTTAIGIITPEDEAEGGTFATKSCQLLECDPFNSQEVSSIFHCLQWGNLGARAWPERVAQFTDVVMAAWARLAEENLLNQIAAGSTQVTAAQGVFGYGAVSNLTSQILVAAAGYRSRFRMAPDSRFVALLPSWVRDLLLSDIINSQFDRYAIDGHAGVDSFLRSKGVEPVWYLDEETGGGQIFAAQGAGTLLQFPLAVKWFLYPIGTWIFLDTGTLELGIIRDSVLNAENEFQVFGESWEAAAQVGFQSLEITSELCPSGATAGPDTILECAA